MSEILGFALEVDDPVLLAAAVEAKGEGLARHFESTFKDTLAGMQEVQGDTQESETPDCSANYVGLLVGGKRRAAWAADPNKGPIRQLGGASESLLEMATACHASKVRRK